MSLQLLVKKYHTFYEVSPYYLIVKDHHVSSSSATRRVQAGFDVDIFAVNTKKELAPPGPDSDYAQGYSELRRIAKEIARHTGDSCSVEAISFPSTAVLDARDRTSVEAMIRIRLSHRGNPDQPASLPEQRALDDVENQLKALGIARR